MTLVYQKRVSTQRRLGL